MVCESRFLIDLGLRGVREKCVCMGAAVRSPRQNSATHSGTSLVVSAADTVRLIAVHYVALF